MIRISAIVCTLDRAAYLELALASLARQNVPRETFEVIVVDNGSTDDTAATVDRARASLPDLLLVDEPRKGLSHARNAGLAHARGAIVAYLDDDAEASPDWLAALLGCFAASTPAPACAGGPIDAIWDGPRPPWLADTMLPYLTVMDWGLPAGDLPEERYIAGANMAFDRDRLRALGGFPTTLGRVGTNLLSNEELVVQRALRGRGGRCVWDPRVRVGHHVHPARLRRVWFVRRYYWQGVSDAVMVGDGAPHATSRRSATSRAIRWLAKAIIGTRWPRFGSVCEAVREAAFAWHMPRPPASA